ncbi:MAG: hypothetical protein GXO82_01025 [Chlorobi bacterium]|nr:hypothetical protein [Chlorobiota bacterium]
MIRTRTKRYVLTLPLAVGLTLLLWQCQSPLETPPVVEQTVTVYVQDSAHSPLPSIPVEVYEGKTITAESSPLGSRLTDASGMVSFDLVIPSTGGSYIFLVGNDNTGRVQVAADLLCRDTTLVILLGGTEIPCNQFFADTLRLEEICAPLPSGQTFSDSIQAQYCSGCPVPLTVSFTPVDDPYQLRMQVFDSDGLEVQGTSFTLPPGGCFTVKAVASPRATGTVTRTTSFTGTGAGGASLRFDLTLEASAIDCNVCACSDTSIIVDFGKAEFQPNQESLLEQVMFNLNRSSCDRLERIIMYPARPAVFQLLDSLKAVMRPGESQRMRVRFTPDQEGTFIDSMIVQSTVPSTGDVCKTTIIFRAEGVQARCCFDALASSRVTTISPDTLRLDLRTRVDGSVEGQVCFTNCGSGGTLEVQQAFGAAERNGFQVSPDMLSLRENESGCFTIRFDARTDIVWPDGQGGRPAVVMHEAFVPVIGCPEKIIHVVARVDTIPTLFSRCIFRWDQNEFLGYNFTPPEQKGSDVRDPDLANQITDFVMLNMNGVASADVRIRSGWKLIRTGVTSQADFTFDIVQQWPNAADITRPPFNTTPETTFDLFSVYSIIVERNGNITYALVRVREISTDGEKEKICLDVLYPMP